MDIPEGGEPREPRETREPRDDDGAHRSPEGPETATDDGAGPEAGPETTTTGEYEELHRNEIRHRERNTESHVCQCVPDAVSGACYRGSLCHNRASRWECGEDCPCGETCGNRAFGDRKKHPKVTVRACGDDRGMGLFAGEPIARDRFIIEYIGEVIDASELERRRSRYTENGIEHFYFMELSRGEYVDATKKANAARFMNHACEPNCRAEKWNVSGEECIGLFADKDIREGEELTWNYGCGSEFFRGKTCQCDVCRLRRQATPPPATTTSSADYYAMETPSMAEAPTPMDSRVQDSCPPGPVDHPLMHRRLSALPPPMRQLELPQPGVLCAIWNCKARETTQWRRGPDGPNQFCNTCGVKWAADNERVTKKISSDGWYEMLEAKKARRPAAMAMAMTAPVPVPVAAIQAAPESKRATTRTNSRGWRGWRDKGAFTLKRRGGAAEDVVFDDIKNRFTEEHKTELIASGEELTVTGEEASRQLEKWVQKCLDDGINLRAPDGPYTKGCELHTRLGFKVHSANTKSKGCKCNACEDEWNDHIRSKLENDDTGWYVMGNYKAKTETLKRKRKRTTEPTAGETAGEAAAGEAGDQDALSEEYASEGAFDVDDEEDQDALSEEAFDDEEAFDGEEVVLRTAPESSYDAAVEIIARWNELQHHPTEGAASNALEVALHRISCMITEADGADGGEHATAVYNAWVKQFLLRSVDYNYILPIVYEEHTLEGLLSFVVKYFQRSLRKWWSTTSTKEKRDIEFFRSMNRALRDAGMYDAMRCTKEQEIRIKEMYRTVQRLDPTDHAYLTSDFTPSSDKRASSSSSSSPESSSQPDSPPPPSEGYGELTMDSFTKVIAEVSRFATRGSSFLDIGCGRGKCCFHWKLYDSTSEVLGIDVHRERIAIAKKCAKQIGPSASTVQFSHENAAVVDKEIDFDIVYCMDKVFTDEDLRAIRARLNRPSSSWRVFVTFRKNGPELENSDLVSTFQISMTGGRNQKHTAYVYRKRCTIEDELSTL